MVSVLVFQAVTRDSPDSENLLGLFVCALSLVPFAAAVSRVERGGWPRVLVVVVPGLLLPPCSLLFGYVGIFVGMCLIPGGALGLILGLMALVRCRVGSAGRALAVLGVTPALLPLAGVALGHRQQFPQGTALVVLAAVCLTACGVFDFRPRR